MKFESSNPAMQAFENTENISLGPTDEFVSAERMTVEGTINKTGLFLLVAMVGGYFGWSTAQANPAMVMPLFWTSLIVSLGCFFAIWKRPEWARNVGFLYSGIQGVFLGAVTMIFESMYPGIATQAVLGTMATTGAMLFAYKTGMIRATPMFKKIIITATMGIMFFYLISLGASFFGANFGVHNTQNASMMSVGFSIFVVAIAALNLIMDFDFIERASNEGAPKHMEWYGAFGLMVTLVWLYFEILKLLAKLRDE